MKKEKQTKKHSMSVYVKEENLQQVSPIYKRNATFSGTTLHYSQFYAIQLIRNIQNHEKYESLIELMLIFEQSLPSMKKNQIYSYVFSGQNEKLLIFWKGQLIGGITFSTIPYRYSKIELFAIKKEKRLQGCGSLLMNAYKHLLQIRKISLIVTNADNNSLDFYYKQSFAEQEYISNHIWAQKTHQFSFSTKLQCLVHPYIDYFLVKQKLRNQKRQAQNRKKQLYFSVNPYHVTIPEPNSSSCFKSRSTQQYFLINPLRIPGLLENGWTQNQYKGQMQLKETKNYRLFGFIFTQIYKNAQVELKKMNQILRISSQVIFSQPIDLQYLSEKLKAQKYENQSQFFEQVIQFFNNAADLYKANQRIMANLTLLKKIVAEHQQNFVKKENQKLLNTIRPEL